MATKGRGFPHPWLVRMGGDACDIHTAALEVNEEQHVVGHQSSKRQNIDREEVGCREKGEVGPNEFRPGGRTFALWRGRYTVAAQHIADRLIGDMISQIGERSDNPIIAPGTIFPGHANNQSLDVLANSRSAGASPGLRSVEFASNEPSVPCEDGVGLSGCGHFAQCPTTESEANFAKR